MSSGVALAIVGELNVDCILLLKGVGVAKAFVGLPALKLNFGGSLLAKEFEAIWGEVSLKIDVGFS